jgi:uncharacterized membrane-anchored protein YhcB (DUF1043 family)
VSWELARIAFYLGLIVGAPAFFFYLVEQKKQDDLSEAESHFYKRSEQENESYGKKIAKDFSAKLAEKDALIKEKEAELVKIRPLLKFLRPPPPGGENP